VVSPVNALGLLKLKCSLQHAIKGQMSGSVELQELMPHRSGGRTAVTPAVRAVVAEPTGVAFSRLLLDYVVSGYRYKGDRDTSPLSLDEVLELRTAAEYWGLDTKLEQRLKSVVLKAVPAPSATQVRKDMLEEEEHGHISLTLHGCIAGLRQAAEHTESVLQQMEDAATTVKSILAIGVVSPFEEHSRFERFPLKERLAVAVQPVLSALHDCQLQALMPVASSDFTDLQRADSVAAVLSATEAVAVEPGAVHVQGGSHVSLVAGSIRRLARVLQVFIVQEKATRDAVEQSDAAVAMQMQQGLGY